MGTPRQEQHNRTRFPYSNLTTHVCSLCSLCCSPVVSGYTFYQLQGVVGLSLDTSAQSLTGYHDVVLGGDTFAVQLQLAQALATACSTAAFMPGARALVCNAFTTFGDLYIVPSSPRFTKLDTSSSSDTYACDGVYVADGRAPLGLQFANASIPAAAEAAGAQAAKSMAALANAAAQVCSRGA